MKNALSQMSEAQVRRLLLLGKVIDHLLVAEGSSVAPQELVGETERERLESVLSDLRELAGEGLMTLDKRLSGAFRATPTQSGRDQWSAFATQRSNPIARRIHLRDVYLRWVYEQTEILDSHPTRDDFALSDPSYYGLPYTATDIGKVGAWLKEMGYIRGPGSWGDESPIHPALTAKGRYTLEHDRSVSDPPPQPTSNTTNNVFNGPTNMAQGNRDVHQEMSVHNEWHGRVVELAAAIEQALPALDVSVQSEVESSISAIRHELEKNREPGAVRKLLTGLVETLTKSGAGALGGALGAQAATVIAALPL